MLLVSTSTSSGPIKILAAEPDPDQTPVGPESASAATSTDASMIAVTSGRNHGHAGCWQAGSEALWLPFDPEPAATILLVSEVYDRRRASLA